MTEAEWLACDDPERMLPVLRRRASQRRFRLFAAACCRRVWDCVPPLDSQEAVEVAERYADNHANRGNLVAARRAAKSPRETQGWDGGMGCAWATTDWSAWRAANAAARMAAAAPPPSARLKAVSSRSPGHTTRREAKAASGRSREVECVGQCNLLRCIFGNPFRPASLDLPWLTPTVISLAQAAYSERLMPSGELDVARLAVLADALEEAGCTDAKILEHARRPRHFRGCWLLDAVLGKA
jgi:hypothetical protein